MGAWGAKAFENDSALDWFAELENGGVAVLREALDAAASSTDYLEVDEGSAAIAAAEIVAAAASGKRDRLSNDAAAWLDGNARAISADDRALAKRAVQRVLGEDSELCQLWDDNGPDNEWRADVRGLLALL
jgi:hypothetical protein